MTTNRDWLFSLPLEEQYAWMNAEHDKWMYNEQITNQAEMLHMPESPTSETMQHIGQVIENTIKRGVYGDTAAQNADSREQLEADVRGTVPEWRVDTIIEWLDRQAAITEEKTRYKWVTASAEEIAAWRSKAEKMKEQVYELATERDELKAELIDERGELNRQINTMRDVIRDYRNERDHYRNKFGKCIDYADAIHALMDEGIA